MARSRHHLPQQMVAERVGFEPTVELPRRMLSKHVDSATLAPLHGRDSQRGGILTWALMSGKVNRGSSIVWVDTWIHPTVQKLYDSTCFLVRDIAVAALRTGSLVREWRNWQTRET